MRNHDGFTVIELLVATALTLVVSAAVFAVARHAPDAFAVQSEQSDMHQRLRVAGGTLTADLIAAHTIYPYRRLGADADPPGTFKRDTITIVGATTTTTYWLKVDDGAGVYQLMASAGGPDVPVADNVVGLAFDYFGDPQPPRVLRPLTDLTGPWTTYGPKPLVIAVPPYAAGENCVFALDPLGASVSRLPAFAPPGVSLVPLVVAQFADGPWCPDNAAADRWDADLLRIRAIVVTLRVQAAAATLRGPAGVLFAHAGIAHDARRMTPDLEIRMRVTPRNLSRAR
jgi:prepilin-type N-terminal cleavage/methylation domain-containing protein